MSPEALLGIFLFFAGAVLVTIALLLDFFYLDILIESGRGYTRPEIISFLIINGSGGIGIMVIYLGSKLIQQFGH